jgi:hypothetical protein
MCQSYLIEYQTIKKSTLAEFKELIEQTEGKNLNELRVKDLVFQNSVPILSGYGVYMFRRKKQVIYVGKASSRSFIERIPSHLDFRTTSWFNKLLTTIKEKEYADCKWTDEVAISISRKAFEELNIVLINIPDISPIRDIEELLIALLNPFNGSKRIKKIQLNIETTIEDNLIQ